MSNWLIDMILGKEVKSTENPTTRDSIVPDFVKRAAYEPGETREETLAKDYWRDINALSDFVLAEKIAELELQGKGYPENFSARFQEALSSCHKDRKASEKMLWDLIPKHAHITEWDEWLKSVQDRTQNENDAKARALKYAKIDEELKKVSAKKPARSKWKEGDHLTAKHDNKVCAYVAYVNEDDKTYTVVVNGTMAPTYYSWGDAHETFERKKVEKEASEHDTESKTTTYEMGRQVVATRTRFVLEAQDEKGFWQKEVESTFLPDIDIKTAVLKEADPDVNIRVHALQPESDAPSAEFKEKQAIYSQAFATGTPARKYTVVAVDSENGIYEIQGPGQNVPSRYTFETAHENFSVEDPAPSLAPGEGGPAQPGQPLSEVEYIGTPEGEILERAPGYEEGEELGGRLTPSQVTEYLSGLHDELRETEEAMKDAEGEEKEKLEKRREEISERLEGMYETYQISQSSLEKQVSGIKVTADKKRITIHLKDGSTSVDFRSNKEAVAKFKTLESFDDLKSTFDLEAISSVERKADDSLLARDTFKELVDKAAAEKWDSETVKKYARESLNTDLTPEQIESVMRRAEAKKSMESGKPPSSYPEGSDGDPAMGVAPMGGTGVFVEPNLGGTNVMAKEEKEADHMMPCPRCKVMTPPHGESDDCPVCAKAHSHASQEDGETFEIGSRAILNSHVGSLVPGMEVRIAGLQNNLVVFQAIHNNKITGFTKFANLDKITREAADKMEEYQWDNKGMKSHLELGDEVKVGNVAIDGRDLKGKTGYVIEKVIVSPTEGKREMHYLVEIEGEAPTTLPSDVLRKSRTAREAVKVVELRATTEALIKKEKTPAGKPQYKWEKEQREEKKLIDKPKEEKKAVLKPNLDTAQEFLDGFKTPPTVVSDMMVQDFLQENNYTASKDDLKELYKIMQSNRVEVRITIPEVETPEQPLPETEKEEVTETSLKIGVGDRVSMKVAANEFDDIKEGQAIEGFIFRMHPDEKTASVMWTKGTDGASHGVELRRLQAAKYKSEEVKPDGSKVTLETPEVPDLGEELEVTNPDGTKTVMKKIA